MSINTREIERKYQSLGLVTQRQTDKQGTVYEPHKHGEVRIFTLKGTVKIKLEDGPWKTIGPGQEIIFQDNQLHEAKVDNETWEYIFATSPEEMKRQGLS